MAFNWDQLLRGLDDRISPDVEKQGDRVAQESAHRPSG